MADRGKVTIGEVAREAGVSLATVSRVLNRRAGKIRISEATRERVMAAAERLGYRADPLAAAMRTGRTGVVGAIIRDVGDPFLALMIKELQRAAHERGLELLLGHAASDPKTARRQLEFMLDRWFDGLVLLGNLPDDSEVVAELERRAAPFVAVARGPEAGIPSVNVDEAHGTGLALDHLRSLGHERIAFVGNLRHAGVRERLAAYERYVEDHSLPWEEGYARDCPSRRSAAVAVARSLLSSPRPPTAVFCASDLLALGAMGGAWRAGKRVPEDVSVVGFDDIEEAADAYPPLTTVRQPTGEMASMAVDLLARLSENPSGDRGSLIARPELVVRDSGAPPNRQPKKG
jgi:LacI family transcriptional regulator